MSEYVDNKGLRKLQLGRLCPRAASVLPQTVATPGTPYFHIYGGLVLMTGLVGEFTVAVGGAVNATWCHNPTVGVDTDICAATALGGVILAGALMTVSGVATEGMLPLYGHAAQLAGGASGGGGRGVVLQIGDLGVFTSASQTGNWKWYMFYVPIDDGAYVRAV